MAGVADSDLRADLVWGPFARALGVNLQRARAARGLSQEKVAHRAGIAANTYQRFEKGESRPGTPMNPRLDTLLALCVALEVSLDELLPADRPGGPTPPASR